MSEGSAGEEKTIFTTGPSESGDMSTSNNSNVSEVQTKRMMGYGKLNGWSGSVLSDVKESGCVVYHVHCRVKNVRRRVSNVENKFCRTMRTV